MNEVLKAAEICLDPNYGCICCPYRISKDGKACVDLLILNAAKVIKAQDREIRHLEAMKDKALNATAEVIKLLNKEINDAIQSNHKALIERMKNNTTDDLFTEYCKGKIHALSGVGSFVKDIAEKMEGDNE